jgi:O-antigen ligase
VPSRFYASLLPRVPDLAPIGACAYIAGFGVPSEWDVPLLALALFGLLAAFLDHGIKRSARSPLAIPVLAYLAATGVSILTSEDIGRSVQLSAPLIPATLLFFLISEHFQGTQHTRLLYITFSAVALGLACTLLWTAWLTGWTLAHARVSDVASPIFVEANDVTLLALVTLMSLALVCQQHRNAVGILAAVSIVLGVSVAAILQSRTAILTAVASLMFATALMRSHHRLTFSLACGTAVLVPVLLIDALLGWPLVDKLSSDWTGTGRISLWRAAWDMFLDAPLVGHGPHTFVLSYQPYLHNLGLPIPPRTIPWAHNLYLETLAERGIVGFGALTFLLASGVSTAWKLRRAAASEVRLFGAAALASLVGFCFAAVFELSFLRLWVVIVLFVVLGIIAQLSLLSEE